MTTHPNEPGHVVDALPYNLEAEQALLGVLLYENSTFLEVDGNVSAKDFHEPFHGRLYKTLGDLIKVGRPADPIILGPYFAIDPAYDDLGGLRYLADLVDRAPPARSVAEYARQVRSMALRRDVIRICRDTAAKAMAEHATEGADLMAHLEKEVLGVRASKADLSLRDFDDVADEVISGMDGGDDRRLVKIGHDKIDNAVGGFEFGDLVVLGGRPGMGKSALASCWALNVALAHQRGLSPVPLGVVILNGEMTTVQMVRRHLTDYAFTRFGEKGPYYRDIRRGTLTDDQKAVLHQCRNELRGLPIRMLKRTGLTPGRMRSLLRRQKMLWAAQGIKLAMVVVDHVGLMGPDEDTRSRGRTEDQTMISGALKGMAGDDELDVVMVALAQLSRKLEERDDKRPTMSDLRDSGSWEQDADIVCGVYRDAYYARREREPKGEIKTAEWMARCASREVEAIFMKVREGEVATARLWADIGRNAIRDFDPTDQLAF